MDTGLIKYYGDFIQSFYPDLSQDTIGHQVVRGLNFATADTQTLWSYTMADEETIVVRAYVNGTQLGTTVFGFYGKTAMANRNGGGAATILVAEQALFPEQETDAGLNAVIDVSGNDIRVRVTNANATNTRWVGRIEYEIITN